MNLKAIAEDEKVLEAVLELVPNKRLREYIGGCIKFNAEVDVVDGLSGPEAQYVIEAGLVRWAWDNKPSMLSAHIAAFDSEMGIDQLLEPYLATKRLDLPEPSSSIPESTEAASSTDGDSLKQEESSP